MTLTSLSSSNGEESVPGTPRVSLFTDSRPLNFIQDFQLRWRDPLQRKWICLKLTVMSISLLFVAVNAATSFMIPSYDVPCRVDKIFDVTDSLNKYLAVHTSAKNALIIISSICIDFIMLYTFLRWVAFGDSIRPLITFPFHYTIRGVIQNIFIMSFPEGYIWSYPGFPSLAVSYGRTSDFFYSGHVGFVVIACLELRALKCYRMALFSFIVSFFESFVLVVTRSHYSIDVIAAYVFGHYIFIMASYFAPWVDDKLGFRRSSSLRKLTLRHVDSDVGL